ncbi:DUF3667 domain-containing protein [Pseudoduganella eburnea]|uniref:DUF3667 domain-containing protein n=1 Tax=Massilia eburnea TaxID=1776165 RepID=A0A6L6QHP1_9BURK|nr:DUF3667 domain-containing protein [Massilia eburnea]MTW11640.1 DUF3667 domain-containing protein [Massilia eburnea]
MHNTNDNTCRNCGATTSGNYCHMCGQETRLHSPSLGEFLHEFIGHYVALEGRLWGTITRLLFRPGLLTTEYIAGRRKRYVEPLRLYLSLSIIFFAVLKLSNVGIVNVDPHAAQPVAIQQAEPEKREAQGDAGKMQEWLKRETPDIYHSIDRFNRLPDQEKSAVMQAGFYKYVPYAIFLLMPLFALWLKLLYLGTGKRYGEHLLFALHTNAFAFVMLAIFMFLPDGFLKFVAFCWVAGYLPWAMQRVYRKGKWGTAWRWLLLGLIHGVSLAIAIFVAMGLAIISAH